MVLELNNTFYDYFASKWKVATKNARTIIMTDGKKFATAQGSVGHRNFTIPVVFYKCGNRAEGDLALPILTIFFIQYLAII
jgi:hypothetical protein